MKNMIAILKQNPKFFVYCLLALGIILIAVMAPLLAPYDPYSAELVNALQKPSAEHLMGTDLLGRDYFSRIIYGTRSSVSSALILVALIFSIGSLIGILAGYFGGWLDTVLMRLADIMIAFPDLILAIAIAGILGPSTTNAIIAITIVSWTRYARLARSLVLKIRYTDYLAAATLTGSKTGHLIGRYLAPNTLPTLIITAATDIGSVMLQMASLSFLGFGAQPPMPEWGYMLSEGRTYLQSAPWLLVFPGLAIFVVVVVFNLLGDSLRDVLDPQRELNINRKSLFGKAKRNEIEENRCIVCDRDFSGGDA